MRQSSAQPMVKMVWHPGQRASGVALWTYVCGDAAAQCESIGGAATSGVVDSSAGLLGSDCGGGLVCHFANRGNQSDLPVLHGIARLRFTGGAVTCLERAGSRSARKALATRKGNL